MQIFPAIDLYQGKAVRLYKGDYAQMTVYHNDPLEVVRDFQAAGSRYLHLVDLEGAKTGTTPNLATIQRIVEATDMFVQVGGGIRSLDTIRKYMGIGVDRVILGTAAVKDPDFLAAAVRNYGSSIAVGIDLKNGYVAVNGWTEVSDLTADRFLTHLEEIGVSTVICTDISRDGAMQGTNRRLYAELAQNHAISLIASGGVTDLTDIRALRELDLYGAIIGKAYYTGAIDLKKAIEVAK